MMSKKLLICIPSLRIGGAAKIALNLSEQYLAQGIDVHILIIDGRKKERIFTYLPVGLSVTYLPSINIHRFILPLINIFYLAKYINQIKPNAIMAVRHDATAISSIAWKLTGKTATFVIRDINPITNTLNRNPVMVSLIKAAYQSATAIIANSTHVSDVLKSKQWVHPEKIYVIGNPVLTEKFFKLASEPMKDLWVSKSNSPLIITIGRLDRMKDQKTLIMAFSLVREKFDCRLLLIGDGPEQGNLISLANDLGLNASIKFAGALENPYPILKRADLFVLSSKYEGFGNVLVEALALGKKIISTDCPGGPAYILGHGKFGRLVPVGDFKALADEISNTLQSKMDPAPLIMRAKDFSVENVANAYSALLFNFN